MFESFSLLADIGDGTLVRAVIWFAIGAFFGWTVPQPAFIKKLLGKNAD